MQPSKLKMKWFLPVPENITLPLLYSSVIKPEILLPTFSVDATFTTNVWNMRRISYFFYCCYQNWFSINGSSQLSKREESSLRCKWFVKQGAFSSWQWKSKGLIDDKSGESTLKDYMTCARWSESKDWDEKFQAIYADCFDVAYTVHLHTLMHVNSQARFVTWNDNGVGGRQRWQVTRSNALQGMLK